MWINLADALCLVSTKSPPFRHFAILRETATPTTTATATATATTSPLAHFTIRQHPDTCQLAYISSTADPSRTFLILLSKSGDDVAYPKANILPKALNQCDKLVQQQPDNRELKDLRQMIIDAQGEVEADKEQSVLDIAARHRESSIKCYSSIGSASAIEAQERLINGVGLSIVIIGIAYAVRLWRLPAN
ncbi:hypothetical protein G7Y89_g15089 [Cudoniella acicularis]|uniref:Uncharacterized protein n=1 Tax=Cudoniella acicularis TaxID=354080 RepID=A0A8H4QTB7_9HELO|nr:hypothetical protein G7Y89_g15089 [Cudoniella acicularis]